MKFNPIILILLIFLPQISALGQPLQKNLELEQQNQINYIIAGWNPIKNKKGSKKGARYDTIIALEKFKQMPELDPYFQDAKGYAVFPNIGKAGFGIGGARGKGEVFQNGTVLGATTVTQLSVGLQLGGQAFSQIIFFKNKKDITRFTEGNFEFGASASAALIKMGAAIEAAYSNGIAVLTISKGGLMYEASLGGQKFNFKEYQ